MLTPEQIERRKESLGASDIHRAVSEPPWGCSKQLWYEKRGQEPDYEDFRNEKVMERGTVLEPIIADIYEKETGRQIRRLQTRYHKTHEWASASIDRQVVNQPNGPGVLECKTAFREVFHKMKREGLPSAYIMQLQWGMFVTGYKWGSYAILWPDGWHFIWFDVERNDTLIKGMFKRASEFWRQVQYGPMPDRLDPGDKRCQTCIYRSTCQGEALLASVKDGGDGEIEIDANLDKHVQSLVRFEEVLAESTDLVNQEKAVIKKKLGDRTVVECTGYRLYFRPHQQETFQKAVLKKNHPDIYEECLGKPTTVRPFKKFAI